MRRLLLSAILLFLLSNLLFAGRYYDAATGRFLQVDPHATKYPSLSPYSYVANNPLKYIDPNGKDIKKPTNQKILWAVRKAYRTSATYRKLHNKVLNNKSQVWYFRGKSKMNPRAKTFSTFPKFGNVKVYTKTTVNLSDETKIYPAGQTAVKTLTNEATHANEQSNMSSQEEQSNYYDTETGKGVEQSGGVCTEEALNNEQQAGSEYYEDTDEDKKYKNMSDDELDKLIFTPEKDKKDE